MIFGTSVAFLRVSESLRSETQSCLGTEKSSRLSKFEKGNRRPLGHSILRSRSLCTPGRSRRGVLEPHGPNSVPLGADVPELFIGRYFRHFQFQSKSERGSRGAGTMSSRDEICSLFSVRGCLRRCSISNMSVKFLSASESL